MRNLPSLVDFNNYVYEPRVVTTVYAKLGDPAKLRCNVGGGDEDVTWFRLPGYQIADVTLPELEFGKVTKEDVGIYYCASQQSCSRPTRSLPVQMIRLVTDEYEIGESLQFYPC